MAQPKARACFFACKKLALQTFDLITMLIREMIE